MAEGKPIPGPGPEDGADGEPLKDDPEKGKGKEYKIGDTYFVWDEEFKEHRKSRIGKIDEKTGDVHIWPEVGPGRFIVKEADMDKMPKSDPGKPPAPDEPIPDKKGEGEVDPEAPEPESEPAPGEPTLESPEDKPAGEPIPEPTPLEPKPEDEGKTDAEPTPDEPKPDVEPEPGTPEPEDKEEKDGPKFKVGDKVIFLDGDEEEEVWIIEGYDSEEDHPYGKPYRIRREADGRVEDVTEDDLKEFIEKAEIDKVEGGLTESEQKFQEEFEKTPEKKKGIFRKLTEFYRKNTLLRIAVGVTSTLMAGAGSSQVVGVVGHALRIGIGAAGGAMAAEGAATQSQNLILKKLREYRGEDGKVDLAKLESLPDNVLEDAYATLTEIASAKGLKIDSALYAKEQAKFKEREEGIKTARDEKKEKVKKFSAGMLEKLRDRFNKIPSKGRTAIIVGGSLLGVVGAGLLATNLIGAGFAVGTAKATGLAFSGGMQMAMGMISTHRQIHAEAFERSDDVEALRHELARRGVTTERFKNISEKAAKNKGGRKKWTIGGAILGGTVAEFLFARGAHAREAAEARAAGAAPHTDASSAPTAESTSPVTPGVDPTTTDGATGSAGTPPVTPGTESTATDYGYTGTSPDGARPYAVLPGEEAPDSMRPYAVLPGEEAPTPATPDYSHTGVPGEEAPATPDYSHTGVPGEEAPKGPLDVTEVIHNGKGSENFLDEVVYADGKENFKAAISAPGGGEKLVDRMIEGLQGKGQLNGLESRIPELRAEWIAKLQVDGIMETDHSIADVAQDKFINTYNPLKGANDILTDMNNGVSHVEILEKMQSAAGDGAMIDTEAAGTISSGAETLTAADSYYAKALAEDGKGHLFIEKMLGSEAPGMSEAQIDLLADKIALKLEADGILNHGGGVVDYERFNAIDPHQIIADVSNDHVSGSVTETANNLAGGNGTHEATGSNIFTQPLEATPPPAAPVEIPGITDALTDLNKSSFEAAKPLSPDQLKEILNPINGYLSREVSEAYQRLLGDETSGVKPEHFRWADVPNGKDQIKLDLTHMPESSSPGHADYVGHQLLKDYNGVTEEQKGFFDRILSGFRKPEAAPSIPDGNAVTGAIPEPQPSGGITAPITPADGTIESGGYAEPDTNTPVAPVEPAVDGNVVSGTGPDQTPDIVPTTPGDGTILSGGEEVKPEVPNTQTK